MIVMVSPERLYFFANRCEQMAQALEAQLAYLGFQLIPPPRWLRSYVRAFWHIQREAPLEGVQEEPMHPRGGFGIVFNFGDQPRLNARPLAAPVFLDGANTVTRRFGFMGRVELMGVQFHEGGAYPFLGIPLIELRNRRNLLDVLGAAELLPLHSRLHEARTAPARFDLLQKWLERRLSLGVQRDAVVPASLAKLRRGIAQLSNGDAVPSIPALADDLAASQRHLERLFRSQVGMSPKLYLRVQRVEAARLALKREWQSNTRLAAALGYYDQAHFIRDFRSIVGITPYAYMKRKHKRTAER